MNPEFSEKEKLQRVTTVMEQMGLTKCQNTNIGIPGIVKGISGGEMKRLSVASEVINFESTNF